MITVSVVRTNHPTRWFSRKGSNSTVESGVDLVRPGNRRIGWRVCIVARATGMPSAGAGLKDGALVATDCDLVSKPLHGACHALP
jgi:hypothetical protein